MVPFLSDFSGFFWYSSINIKALASAQGSEKKKKSPIAKNSKDLARAKSRIFRHEALKSGKNDAVSGER